jgi:acetate kinase
MRILVVNVGSSSVKYAAFDGERLFDGAIEHISGLRGYDSAAARMLEDVRSQGFEPEAIAHRIVHGFGLIKTSRFTKNVRQHIVKGCAPAPLHNIPQLHVLDALASGSAIQVCVFDSLSYEFSDDVRTLPLPSTITKDHGIMRIGFHGISHTSVARRVKSDRLITVHLGSGSSVTAWKRGKALWNSMEFTPDDGVMMATRPGSLDPGTVSYLYRLGYSSSRVEDILNRESGLVGISGTADLEVVIAKMRKGNRYDLAYRMLIDSIAQVVASAATHSGGIDTIAFTGTIGVRSGKVRAAVLKRLSFLKPFDVKVLETGEEAVIHDEALALLSHRSKRA